MVALSKVKYYIKVLRPGNLLLIMAAQFIIKWLIFDRVYYEYDIAPTFSFFNFFLLSIVTLIITGAGNLINDIFDLETDANNPAKKPTVGIYISVSDAWKYYASLLILGAAISVYLAYKLDFWNFLYIYPLAHLILFIYSRYLKMTPLLGNFVVAIFIGASCLVLWLAEYRSYLLLMEIAPNLATVQAQLIIGFSCLAYVINFTREIVKDMEDYDADKSSNLPTTAVYFGLPLCRKIATLWLIGTFSFLWFWQYVISPDVGHIAFWFFQLVFIPAFAVIMILFLLKNDSRNYGRVSSSLKYLQLLGLIYVGLTNF